MPSLKLRLCLTLPMQVWLERALESGQVKPHPWTKIDGGLQGVEDGLIRLKAGEARGTKFVYDIGGRLEEAGGRDTEWGTS